MASDVSSPLFQVSFADLIEKVREVIRQELDSKGQPVNRASAEIIDREELCKRLNITAPTARQWERKGKIPFFKIGSNIRYNWPAVVEALENKKGKK